MDGKALGVDDGGQVAVANASADRDGLCDSVDGDVLEVGRTDLGLRTVGNGVEGMTRAEGPDAGVVFDDLLELGDGGRFEDIAGVVGQIAGPVFKMLIH